MIEELQRRAAANRDSLSLGGGLPAPELFPRGALGRAFYRAMGEARGRALQYGWPEGDEQLRLWLATRLCAAGARVTHEDVVVTSGAQQGLAIAVETLLQPGDDVLVDERCYPGALELFRRAGARPTTHFTKDTRAAYVMPGSSNPRGMGLSEERRRELVSLNVPIIADEAYAELRFDHRREPLLLSGARDRTWHVGTFSKTLCPGLRVGYLVAPPQHTAKTRERKRAADLECGSLSQAVLAAFLTYDHFDARLARTRRFYESRAHKLVRALRRRFPSFRFQEPEGGFTIFVETDCLGDEVALLEKATEHGVCFDPGSMFCPDGTPSPVAMRLSFSSVSPLWMDEAVARLERAWREWRRSPLRLSHGARKSDIRALQPRNQLDDLSFDSSARSDAAE